MRLLSHIVFFVGVLGCSDFPKVVFRSCDRADAKAAKILGASNIEFAIHLAVGAFFLADSIDRISARFRSAISFFTKGASLMAWWS